MTTEPAARTDNPARAGMRWILIATPFGQAWSVLVSGACWICFTEEMGLKDRRFAWGLLAAIPFIGLLFQLAGSYFVERTNRRKPAFFIGYLTSRLTWVAIAAMPLLLGLNPAAAIACVLALFMLHHSASAFAVPSWTSWMSDTIPPATRGRFFGMRAQIGPFVVVPLGLLAAWLIAGAQAGQLSYPRPQSLFSWSMASIPFGVSTLKLCSIFFVIAAVLGAIEILLFASVPDQPRPRTSPAPGLYQLLIEPLRNPNFRRFLLFYGVLYLSVPGIGYYVWLYVKNPDGGVGVGPFWANVIFFGGGQLGLVLFSGMWGRLIDRFGRKAVWTVACVIPVMLPMLYGAIHPAYAWIGFFIAVIDVLGWQGMELANFNALLDFSGGQRGTSSYQAVFGFVLAITGCISGLFFGKIASWVGDWQWTVGWFTFNYFHVVFAVATAMRLAACVALLPRVVNDGRQPVRQAVGAMLAGVVTRARAPLAAVRRAFAPDR